ncbi:MAG: glycosyltransferase [Chloroflexota bacterium]|nr:glycosyltransferase [Chloroflexota bacterium]
MNHGAGDYLLLVGRVAPEKGIAEAIEVARRSGRRLVVAAKVYDPKEQQMFDKLVQPAIDEGVVDWRGEVDAAQRDELMAGALATLMLGAWPEPFGLVAIESMATGTPVIARRAGANTETIQHGSSGYLIDDIDEALLAVAKVPTLNRRQVAAYARGRFSTERMVSEYEQAYAMVMAAKPAPQTVLIDQAPTGRLRVIDPADELDEPA